MALRIRKLLPASDGLEQLIGRLSDMPFDGGRRTSGLIHVLGGLLLMGCAADKTPMMLDLQSAAQVQSRDVEVMGINCPVQVGSIVDDRPKKDDMGIISQ